MTVGNLSNMIFDTLEVDGTSKKIAEIGLQEALRKSNSQTINKFLELLCKKVQEYK